MINILKTLGLNCLDERLSKYCLYDNVPVVRDPFAFMDANLQYRKRCKIGPGYYDRLTGSCIFAYPLAIHTKINNLGSP